MGERLKKSRFPDFFCSVTYHIYCLKNRNKQFETKKRYQKLILIKRYIAFVKHDLEKRNFY